MQQREVRGRYHDSQTMPLAIMHAALQRQLGPNASMSPRARQSGTPRDESPMSRVSEGTPAHSAVALKVGAVDSYPSTTSLASAFSISSTPWYTDTEASSSDLLETSSRHRLIEADGVGMTSSASSPSFFRTVSSALGAPGVVSGYFNVPRLEIDPMSVLAAGCSPGMDEASLSTSIEYYDTGPFYWLRPFSLMMHRAQEMWTSSPGRRFVMHDAFEAPLHPAVASLVEQIEQKEAVELVSGAIFLDTSLQVYPTVVCCALRSALTGDMEQFASGVVVACVWHGQSAAASLDSTLVVEEPEEKRMLRMELGRRTGFPFQLVTTTPGDAARVRQELQAGAGRRLQEVIGSELAAPPAGDLPGPCGLHIECEPEHPEAGAMASRAPPEGTREGTRESARIQFGDGCT